MDDSDNSTSLPVVTRRSVMKRAMMATAALTTQTAGGFAEKVTGFPAFDPAMALWHEWQAAYNEALAQCRIQQVLETTMVRNIGFPHVKVYLPDDDTTVTLYSQEQIEELFGDNPAMDAHRAKAISEFVGHAAQWDAADRRLGYSAAKQAEETAACETQKLAEELMTTPARSLAGVAGKLDVVLREGESCEECTEFPWPQLRSVLADVLCVGQQLQPDAFMPSTEHSKASTTVAGKRAG